MEIASAADLPAPAFVGLKLYRQKSFRNEKFHTELRIRAGGREVRQVDPVADSQIGSGLKAIAVPVNSARSGQFEAS